jgi:hypothetical protein
MDGDGNDVVADGKRIGSKAINKIKAICYCTSSENSVVMVGIQSV